MLNFSLLGCLALNLHNSRLEGVGGGANIFLQIFSVGFHVEFYPPGLPETGLKVGGGWCVEDSK